MMRCGVWRVGWCRSTAPSAAYTSELASFVARLSSARQKDRRTKAAKAKAAAEAVLNVSRPPKASSTTTTFGAVGRGGGGGGDVKSVPAAGVSSATATVSASTTTSAMSVSDMVRGGPFYPIGMEPAGPAPIQVPHPAGFPTYVSAAAAAATAALGIKPKPLPVSAVTRPVLDPFAPSARNNRDSGELRYDLGSEFYGRGNPARANVSAAVTLRAVDVDVAAVRTPVPRVADGLLSYETPNVRKLMKRDRERERERGPQRSRSERAAAGGSAADAVDVESDAGSSSGSSSASSGSGGGQTRPGWWNGTDTDTASVTAAASGATGAVWEGKAVRVPDGGIPDAAPTRARTLRGPRHSAASFTREMRAALLRVTRTSGVAAANGLKRTVAAATASAARSLPTRVSVRKGNSTNTIFTQHSIAHPDDDELVVRLVPSARP
jgi:hypothetical protein